MESDDDAKEVVRKLRLEYIQDQLQAIWDNMERVEIEGDPKNKKNTLQILKNRFEQLEEREMELLRDNPKKFL